MPDSADTPPDASVLRVGVVDIGSNSIRLVVYDRLSRQPIPLFNEKVLCGLGRALQQTGRLDPEGSVRAVENLRRFRKLCDGMGVRHLFVIATAAVRDAADGEAFATEVARRCGLTVRIISGEEEARLAALGLISGLPAASGVVGDLGGGSLELVDIDDGTIRAQATLPLGPLRLMADGGKAAARRRTRSLLASIPWLSRSSGRTFYPVGGAWRSLARVQMAQADYPLHVIQSHTVSGREMAALTASVSRQRKATQTTLPGASKRRLETLPYAALVLDEILSLLAPELVTFSAYGLREGLLLDQLGQAERAADPLLAGCEDLARQNNRFGHETAILRWTDPLARLMPPDLDRLRRAACLLSDLGWAEHPDYRAEHAANRALRLPIGGLLHAERAFMALALAVRYGAGPTVRDIPALRLLDAGSAQAATLVGLTLRLAHTITGGAPRLLEGVRLDLSDDPILLTVTEGEASLVGEVVRRRLDALAKALGRGAEVDVTAAGAVERLEV